MKFYKKPDGASWSDYHRARKYHRRKARQYPRTPEILNLYWHYHGRVFKIDTQRQNEKGEKWVAPLWDIVTFGDAA